MIAFVAWITAPRACAVTCAVATACPADLAAARAAPSCVSLAAACAPKDASRTSFIRKQDRSLAIALASLRAFLGLMSFGQAVSKIGSTLWAQSWAHEIIRW